MCHLTCHTLPSSTLTEAQYNTNHSTDWQTDGFYLVMAGLKKVRRAFSMGSFSRLIYVGILDMCSVNRVFYPYSSLGNIE